MFFHFSSLKSVFGSLVTPQHHCPLLFVAFRASLLSSTRSEIIFISDKHRCDMNYCNMNYCPNKTWSRQDVRAHGKKSENQNAVGSKMKNLISSGQFLKIISMTWSAYWRFYYIMTNNSYIILHLFRSPVVASDFDHNTAVSGRFKCWETAWRIKSIANESFTATQTLQTIRCATTVPFKENKIHFIVTFMRREGLK